MSSPRWPLAVTGGIAEGKSTVVGFLSDLGLRTFSADECVRELWTRPGVTEAVAEALDLSPAAGKQDILSAIALNAEARRAVNSVFHPLVFEEMEKSSAQVFEIPLLIETCLVGHFQEVWVVTCGPEEQAERLRKRGLEPEKIAVVMQMQLRTRAKLPFGDEVVRTNQPMSSVRETIETALRRSGLRATPIA